MLTPRWTVRYCTGTVRHTVRRRMVLPYQGRTGVIWYAGWCVVQVRVQVPRTFHCTCHCTCHCTFVHADYLRTCLRTCRLPTVRAIVRFRFTECNNKYRCHSRARRSDFRSRGTSAAPKRAVSSRQVVRFGGFRKTKQGSPRDSILRICSWKPTRPHIFQVSGRPRAKLLLHSQTP